MTAGKAHNLIDSLGGNGGLVLLAVLIIVAGTWGFIALLDEVKEGDTQHFDDWAIRTVGGWQGPPPSPDRRPGPPGPDVGFDPQHARERTLF